MTQPPQEDNPSAPASPDTISMVALALMEQSQRMEELEGRFRELFTLLSSCRPWLQQEQDMRNRWEAFDTFSTLSHLTSPTD